MQKHLVAAACTTVLIWSTGLHAACTNRTIHRDYAFTVEGSVISDDGKSVAALIGGVGIVSFNGNGVLAQEDFIVLNGAQVPVGPPTNPSNFQGGETGTYRIDQDCTGSMHLVLGAGNERDLALVIAGDGTKIHAIQSSGLLFDKPFNAQLRVDMERLNQHHDDKH